MMKYFTFLLTLLFTFSVLADGSDYWYSEPTIKKVIKKKRRVVRKAPTKVAPARKRKVLTKRKKHKKHKKHKKQTHAPVENRDIVMLKPSPGQNSRYRKVNAARPGPSASSINATYSQLGIDSIWTNASGGLNSKGENFLDYMKNVGKHGLVLNEYYLSKINNALNSGADADKLISRAVVKLAQHAKSGRLISKKADPDWHISQSGVSQGDVLKAASSRGDIGSYIENLFPQTRLYQNLVGALVQQQQKGNWSAFPTAGPKLQLGSSHQHVSFLRQRLADSGYLSSAGGGYYFDSNLSNGLIRFQNDHGLNGDGVLGRITRLTLATSSSQRSKQIVTTLERLRWLPDNLGDRYIMVNTAGYQLNMIENDRTALNMRIVVGKKRQGKNNHETPSFSRNMRYLVLNPRWYVPPSIASKELLLLAQKDKNYFKKRGYKVYDSKGEVKSNKVNWNKYTKGEKLPLQIVQNSGARNALGKIKFMLPNKYNIYLHDTPQKSLFARDRRAFSHGCVRLSQPMQLATQVTGKSQAELLKMISNGRNQRVNLPQKIPVYIVYLTAWARDDGSVIFFDDYFNRDGRMQNNFS